MKSLERLIVDNGVTWHEEKDLFKGIVYYFDFIRCSHVVEQLGNYDNRNVDLTIKYVIKLTNNLPHQYETLHAYIDDVYESEDACKKLRQHFLRYVKNNMYTTYLMNEDEWELVYEQSKNCTDFIN